jgi:hypothetical protein
MRRKKVAKKERKILNVILIIVGAIFIDISQICFTKKYLAKLASDQQYLA